MSADPLSDVLASLRLTGAIFFAIDGTPPWVAEVPPASEIARRVMPEMDYVVEFHAVIRGHCFGGIVDEEPVRLEAGDVICFPHGDAHVVSSARGMRARVDDLSLYDRPASALPFPVKFGTGSPEVHLLCGFLGCEARPFNPLLSTLPRVLHASDRRGSPSGWLAHFIELAAAETQRRRPGGVAVLGRLAELMFIETLRRHLETLAPDRTGWLAGLRDVHVGKALAALHAKPAEAWSVDALSREAGLSRSAMAERFTSLVGEPPIQYLARWRMQLAAALLATTHDGVARIAERVGYASEAAFSRAFKKLVGVPPATWRQRRAAQPGVGMNDSTAASSDASVRVVDACPP